MTSLSGLSYSIWRRELVESLKYDVTCLDGGGNRVTRKGHEESSARLLNHLGRCDCAAVFSYGAQCRHEMAIKLEFIKEHWFSRHWQRDKLSVYHLTDIAQTCDQQIHGAGGETPHCSHGETPQGSPGETPQGADGETHHGADGESPDGNAGIPSDDLPQR